MSWKITEVKYYKTEENQCQRTYCSRGMYHLVQHHVHHYHQSENSTTIIVEHKLANTTMCFCYFYVKLKEILDTS